MSFKHDVKSIATLGWPMLIGSLAGVGQGAADAIMAGHYSRVDLAGVGLGVGYFVTVYVAMMGTMQALPPIVGRLFGAGAKAEIGETFRQGLWIAFLLGIVGAVIVAHPGLWLAAAKPSAEVEAKTRLFCLLIAPEFVALLMLRCSQMFSQAVSEPKAPMVASIGMLALNIFFNWVFIYGKLGMPEMGGPGCGLASTLSAFITVSVYLLYISRAARFKPYSPFVRWSKPSWAFQKDFLKLGVPIGVTTFVEVSGFTLMQVFIAPLGAMIASAHTAVGNFSAVVYMLPMAAANASAILISQAIGANDPKLAMNISRSAIKLSFIIAATLMVLILMGRPFIAAGYTNDVEVRGVIVSLLIAIAAYQLFDCSQCVVQGVLRGFKITLLPTIVFIVALWGVGLGGGWWLAFRGVQLGAINLAPLGAAGFWWGSVAGLAIVTAVLTPYALNVARRVGYGLDGKGA
jgi:multidrug resistance protein, MATE family